MQNILQTIANSDNHPLKDFGVIHTQKVEWGDMDAFGHVNNVQYYEYNQSARIHYLEQLAMFDKTSYTVLASSSCQYLRPVTYPDTLWIGVRSKKIGNTSLTNEYTYFSTEQNAVVATAETVIVFFDSQGENKQPLTEQQKAELMALDRGELDKGKVVL